MSHSSTPTSTPTRLLIGLPLLLLVCAIGYHGFRWGLGSLETWRAAAIAIRLPDEPRPGSAELADFARAMEWLDRAESLRGQHPEQSDLRGQLLFWRAIHFADPGPPRGMELEVAAEHFRQALDSRPAWPYFWANLALAKAEAGVFDEEFRLAVRRAVETGPWERQVQLQMIRLDFVEAGRIDPQTRELIDRLLKNAVQTQPAKVMNLADTFEQMARICGLLDHPGLDRRCAPYRAKNDT